MNDDEVGEVKKEVFIRVPLFGLYEECEKMAGNLGERGGVKRIPWRTIPDCAQLRLSCAVCG